MSSLVTRSKARRRIHYEYSYAYCSYLQPRSRRLTFCSLAFPRRLAVISRTPPTALTAINPGVQLRCVIAARKTLRRTCSARTVAAPGLSRVCTTAASWQAMGTTSSQKRLLCDTAFAATLSRCCAVVCRRIPYHVSGRSSHLPILELYEYSRALFRGFKVVVT